MKKWPQQWWCNHTEPSRFGPPFYECGICSALGEPQDDSVPTVSMVEARGGMRVLSIALLATILVAAGAAVVVWGGWL